MDIYHCNTMAIADWYNKIGKIERKINKKTSYLSWTAALFLNSFSNDISHIQVLSWRMPSSKKYV
jgi:hypothetical protein